MNRFKNADYLDQYMKDMRAPEISGRHRQVTISSIFGDEYGEVYQDLYDMLSDDYRGGYHGSRKTKLLLYIAHRAYREYGVIIHTGNGFAPLDANDTHHGDPADLAVLLDDYSYSFVEHEDVLEFLAGIR